jgi:hypothetical protein
MAYDSKNKLSQMLIGILEKSPLGQFVDYEHNAVPAKSDKWVSYKALYDASKKMITRPESDTPAAMCEDLECYWNAWYMLTDLEGYAKTCKSGEFRKEYLPSMLLPSMHLVGCLIFLKVCQCVMWSELLNN